MSNQISGKFDAKIKDYGTSETKTAGNPQVYINFEFQTEDGNVVEKTWYGSFVGGAKDITLKTLIYCGLVPQNYGMLANFVNGVQSNLLDLNKILTLDIQIEPDLNGVMKSKIQWVNDPASAPVIKKIDEAKNSQFFGSMNFDGDLMRLAGEMGVPTNNQNNGGGQQQQMNNGQQQNNYQTQGNQQQMNNGGQQTFNNPQTNQNQQQNNQQQQNMNQQNNGQGQNNGNNFQAPF